MTMFAALTYDDVARRLGERPCKDDFREAAGQLPNWKITAYSPRQMAAHGVKHSSIIWAFMRPEALGERGMIEAACRMAERVLPLFEAKLPDDDRPRKAIAAARSDNMKAAAKAAQAAWAASLTAETAEAARAAWAAEAAAEAARAATWPSAAAEAAEAKAAAAEQSAQIEILEAVIAELAAFDADMKRRRRDA